MNNPINTHQTFPILLATDPMLRKKALKVTSEDLKQVQAAIPKMFDTMYQASGIGLAAPQVGISLRFFIVDLMKDDLSEKMVFINPEIIQESNILAESQEGCLSFPDQYADVTRPEKITVRYQDLTGNFQELEADGLLARCIQHETDHLNGVLFVDRLSPLKKNMIIRKIAKRQKLAQQ